MIFSKLMIEEKMRELETLVQKYLNAGEIMNQQYKDLKFDADRVIEKLGNEIAKEHTHGKGQELDALGLSDLSWAIPDSTLGLLALKNKLKKFVKIDHPLATALRKLYDDHHELAEQIKELKTKVVTATQKRDEVKKEVEVQKNQRFSDSKPLITELMKFIDVYVAEAETRAEAKYKSVLDTVKQHDWNLDELAPKPHSNMSRGEYRAASNYRMFLVSLFDKDVNDPFIKHSSVKKHRFIDMIKDQARTDYLGWINKMTEKIGKPVASASVKGNPWVDSVLSVITIDGEVQVWDTQMIINTSKLGKLFNQFPSTRKK